MRRGRFEYNVQPLNVRFAELRKQFRVTFVTIVEDENVIKRYAVIEAPDAYVNAIVARIFSVVGKCKIFV